MSACLVAAHARVRERVSEGEQTELCIIPAGPRADRRGGGQMVRGRFVKFMAPYRMA